MYSNITIEYNNNTTDLLSVYTVHLHTHKDDPKHNDTNLIFLNTQ